MDKQSINIDKEIIQESEKIISLINSAPEDYYNEALARFNKFQQRLLLAKELIQESKLVRENSMKVLKDFEDIEYTDSEI